MFNYSLIQNHGFLQKEKLTKKKFLQKFLMTWTGWSLTVHERRAAGCDMLEIQVSSIVSPYIQIVSSDFLEDSGMERMTARSFIRVPSMSVQVWPTTEAIRKRIIVKFKAKPLPLNWVRTLRNFFRLGSAFLGGEMAKTTQDQVTEAR